MQLVLHHLSDGDILEVEVAGVDDFLLLVVHNAGRADTHHFNLLHRDTGILCGSAGSFCHTFSNFYSRASHQGFFAGFGNQLKLFVHHACDDVGSAQVDADVIFHHKNTPLGWVCLFFINSYFIIAFVGFLFNSFLKDSPKNDRILHKTLRKIVIGNDEKSFKNRKSVRDKWSKTQESQH